MPFKMIKNFSIHVHSKLNKDKNKNIQHRTIGTHYTHYITTQCPSGSKAYRLRPAILPSSFRSRGEEVVAERCGKAEASSVGVWAGLLPWLVVVLLDTQAGGWGLRRPVRLSRGTGVTDAAPTSPVLPWGFTWFLFPDEAGGMQDNCYSCMVTTPQKCTYNVNIRKKKKRFRTTCHVRGEMCRHARFFSSDCN